MEKILNFKLEALKHRLVDLVLEKESLVDPHVVEISQEMDLIILQLQRMRMLKGLQHRSNFELPWMKHSDEMNGFTSIS